MKSGKAWFALTRVPVDSINTSCPISTRVTVAFIYVNFTVDSGCAWFASTPVDAHLVLAISSMLTWIRFTFIDLSLTQISSITRITVTCKRIISINANTTLARIGQTIVNIGLA
jgi:hypothetical protein